MDEANPLAEFEGERIAPPAVFVIFGASGDLAARKLIPALANLWGRRLLHPNTVIVGVARTAMSDHEFAESMRSAVEQVDPDLASTARQLFEQLRYVSGGYDEPDTFDRLQTVLKDLDQSYGTGGNRVHYLATPPATFPDIVASLAGSGLNRASDGSFVRVVVEKPFGRDGRTAASLDAAIHDAFDEEQVYRIDHYLGKETVQNVLALRFANTIFEPVWDRRYVSHVQITVAEALGVGRRGGFYESAGALRDIVQNHVLQVLALTLMEGPASFDAESIRDEKVKALRAVEIMDAGVVRDNVVRAQYVQGWSQGREVVGYRDEDGVDPLSQTETYVAMRLKIDNGRWAGVPVYVRTGKYLPRRVTEVALTFHRPPHLPFKGSQSRELQANSLVLRVQPDEGISLRFGAKVPGQAFDVRSVSMDFSYGAAFIEESPEAYERLLLDALLGDPTLFIRSDEVQRAWAIVDPIIEAWEDERAPLCTYPAGAWGPSEADALLEREGHQWRTP